MGDSLGIGFTTNADARLVGSGRSLHDFANCVEHDLELRIVLPFQFGQLACEFFVARK